VVCLGRALPQECQLRQQWLNGHGSCSVLLYFQRITGAWTWRPPLLSSACRHVATQVNKAHQLADWRVRPLDPVLLAYARQDTHHLLCIADRLKVWAWRRANSTHLPI
jgi:hypothetical protein